MALSLYKDPQVKKMNTDGRSSGKVFKDAFVRTTDATATVAFSIPVPVLSGVQAKISVIGVKDDGTEGIGSEIITRARRANAGNVTLIGANTAVGTAEDSAGTPTVVVNANTTTQALEVVVTGEVGKNILWTVGAEYMMNTATGIVNY
jgi:hypothetical protein